VKKLSIQIIFFLIPLLNFCQSLNFTIFDRRTFGDYPALLGSPRFDTNGNLWITGALRAQPSQYGIIQYDGTSWVEHFNPTTISNNNSISNILIDSSNQKWYTDYKMPKAYMINFNGTWSNYWLDSIIDPLWTIQTVPHYIGIDKNDTKWFIDNNKSSVTRLNGFNATYYDCTSILGLPFPNCDFNFSYGNAGGEIDFDNNGNVWFGTGIGVLKFDGVTWNHFSSVNSGLPNDTITSLAVEPNGNVWIGTYNAGLVMFDGLTWTQFLPSNSGLKSKQIRSLTISPAGELWIGTQTDDFSGFNLVRFNGANWFSYDVTDNIFPNSHGFKLSVEEIEFAPNGSIWLTSMLAIATAGNIPTLVDGQKENFDFQNINLYPNPSKSALNIDLQDGMILKELKINNLIGQEFPLDYEILGNKVLVNTELLNVGSYILSVETNKGVVRKSWIKYDKE